MNDVSTRIEKLTEMVFGCNVGVRLGQTVYNIHCLVINPSWRSQFVAPTFVIKRLVNFSFNYIFCIPRYTHTWAAELKKKKRICRSCRYSCWTIALSDVCISGLATAVCGVHIYYTFFFLSSVPNNLLVQVIRSWKQQQCTADS